MKVKKETQFKDSVALEYLGNVSDRDGEVNESLLERLLTSGLDGLNTVQSQLKENGGHRNPSLGVGTLGNLLRLRGFPPLKVK